MATREENMALAKLCEQAERYDQMADYMKAVRAWVPCACVLASSWVEVPVIINVRGGQQLYKLKLVLLQVTPVYSVACCVCHVNCAMLPRPSIEKWPCASK